ncbi:TIGR04255 family protein [Salmonella enterica subsp. enterica]|uniref:TIGR04255 family protein n=1 Tax=Salmonella enterica I TaxID=59201 RepID=A0A5Y3M6G4_SALET|nr:TIGR04255 family protein [Salmonella enterica subsp. enterica]
MSDSNRMSNAPVYYALAQVKFSPIKAMKRYVDDIQDALRLKGYPLFEQKEAMQMKFDASTPSEPPQPSFETVQQWYMSDIGKTSGFVLGNDFITFQTTDYKGHEPFFKMLMEGLAVVIEHSKPALLTRLGLRYLDAVTPSGNETIEQYLCNGLHGVDLNLAQIQSINEMVFQTNVGPIISHGFLVTRLHKMYGQLGFPPDLVPTGVDMLDRFRSEQALWHGIIDTDHYVEGNLPPEIDLIEKQFNSLHGVVKETFNKMVSQYAIDRWV